MFLSIVIPTFKSSLFIKKTIRELYYFLEECDFSYEVIVINDKANDNTWHKVQEICTELNNIRAYKLYKNFGQHYSNHIGFIKSKGDFVITMDDDGQNPPDQIMTLLNEEIKTKADLVVGVYKERHHNFFRILSSKLMNTLIKKIFDTPNNFKSSNFRLLKRILVERIIDSNPKFPYTTGQALKYASNVENVFVKHRKSFRKKSNYNIFKLFSLAWNALTNYSNLPLRIVSLGGLFLSLLSIIIFIYIILLSIFMGINTPGWASICALISFFSSLQFIILAVMSEYLYKQSNSTNHCFEMAINNSYEKTT